jgi:hypothetical protein
MKVYVVWQEDKKTVAVMDVTKIVQDALIREPHLQTVVVANAIMDVVEADFILTTESEEEMLNLFPNAIIQKEVH